MRNYVGADPFILIAKNTQRHHFDYQYSSKIFTGFIKCVGMSEVIFNSINRCISKIFVQQNLKLTAKKTKKLKV
ncbi:hypothetical protein E5K93_00775 [Helicobacter pylori]|nr:hypothetical protein E5K93_00775 [Helicobacter pylori]